MALGMRYRGYDWTMCQGLGQNDWGFRITYLTDKGFVGCGVASNAGDLQWELAENNRSEIEVPRRDAKYRVSGRAETACTCRAVWKLTRLGF